MTFLTTNTITMALLLTLGLNKYFGVKYLYGIWCLGINTFQSGILLMTPSVYSKCFGNNNLILIHGIEAVLGIPSLFITSFFSPWILDNYGYDALFSISCVFSTIGKP